MKFDMTTAFSSAYYSFLESAKLDMDHQIAILKRWPTKAALGATPQHLADSNAVQCKRIICIHLTRHYSHRCFVHYDFGLGILSISARKLHQCQEAS